jgi:uncharacterized protein CbrC (UPF0167 family)
VTDSGTKSGSEPLPRFQYHPDPIATGSIEVSGRTCDVCLRPRGFLYAGPVYTSRADEASLCPWCIADGSAASQLAAQFTDTGPGLQEAPPKVIKEVLTRTPGFMGWQQEQWPGHCSDAAVYLGRVGAAELGELPAAAIEVLRQEARSWGGWTGPAVDEYLASLSADGMPTGYLFQCRHCDAYLGYSDFT